MQDDQGFGEIGSGGALGSDAANGRDKISQLFGSPKRNAVKRASKHEGIETLDPKQLKRREYRKQWYQKRKAAAARSSGADNSEEEGNILQVAEPIVKKTKPATPQEVDSSSVKQIAELLFVGHMVGSRFIRVEELSLTRDESQELSVALANVMRWYDITPMAEKTKDWLFLFGAGAMIYGPKLGKIKDRVKKAKEVKIAVNPTGGIQRAEAPPEFVVSPSAVSGEVFQDAAE